MVWTPKYYAVQEEGVIDNALVIIARDFKEALDVFYPTEALLTAEDPQYLEDFQVLSLGQIERTVFPCLAIGPNRNPSTESDAADRLRSAVRFDIYVGVTADSAANVTRKIMRYIGTLDAVLRSARKSDWKRNMSFNSFGFVLEMEHVYGPVRDRESIYFRDALMQVTLSFNEQ